MKNILIVGGGLSTPSLIKYLLDHSEEHNWKITLGDMSLETAQERIDNHPNGIAIQFDVFNDEQRVKYVQKSDIIVSMLPARFHYLMAKSCVKFKKNMVTASYVSDEIKELHLKAKESGVLILNEIGLDPGIDHMSAMKVIDEIKEEGGELLSFISSTGGLVAPKCDNNPWNYKFTWNPRNVVLAGQSGAQFIQAGMYKHIPYHKLFTRINRINIDGYGEFEVYPNRDSLSYREVYGLENIPTMFRGTIRKPGFCRTWNGLIQLGLTDDTFKIKNSEDLTYRDFVNTFLRYDDVKTVEQKFAAYAGFSEDSIEMYKCRWLGLFDRTPIGIKNATPAQILQKILEEKWQLDDSDRDMIVMQHRFEYEINGAKKKKTSSLVVEGQNNTHTGMALTVGLPVAIATKMILTNQIATTGVAVPTKKSIYEPVLKEMEAFGIKFIETEE